MAKKKGKLKSMRSPAVNKQPAVEAATIEPPPIVVTSSPVCVLMKVCRLCETKEGPFLYIFEGEKNTAKKIEELMPFEVAENDELPHKICFRCSAKVEELHEFVQKCIKTQENLYNSLGKKFPSTKVTHRSLWEEKLNRSNITNDDICDAVIKKAMEGIKDIPLKSIAKIKASTSDTSTKKLGEEIKKEEPIIKKKNVQNVGKVNKVEPEIKKKNCQIIEKVDTDVDMTATDSNSEVKLCLQRCDDKQSSTTRSSRSNTDKHLLEGIPTKPKKAAKPQKAAGDKNIEPSPEASTPVNKNAKVKPSLPDKDTSAAPVILDISVEKKVDVKPFNIMDHVSMIKVNGVGVLFQCQLCNRNFLTEEVVLSHWCAKNRAAKEDIIKRPAPPEPPRIATVKYINTKIDDAKNKQDIKGAHNSKNDDHREPKAHEDTVKKSISESKPKPRIGPASKVKKINDTVSEAPVESSSSKEKSGAAVQCPVVPGLNCRYKLVPGPNNTLTLIEAHTVNQKEESSVKTNEPKKRKIPENEAIKTEDTSKQRKVLRSENAFPDKGKISNPEVIAQNAQNSENQGQNGSGSQPYPVGLFQTVNRPSNNASNRTPAVVPFAPTTEKKQSYTIVQTSNPSKLLISKKPQPQIEEVPKKKQKKSKSDVTETPVQQQPFSVTLEDASHPKDSGFFTFINVDPLLQPSYVLPTDNNIIQESQISTSAQNSGRNAPYTCNICNEKFTREQKLLVHIKCHYNKMDEEEQMRTEKPRNRGKKT